MRTLTIKRKKKRVGQNIDAEVYIEDAALGNETFGKTLYRKLGVLKNGEERSFLIEEDAAKLLVFATKPAPTDSTRDEAGKHADTGASEWQDAEDAGEDVDEDEDEEDEDDEDIADYLLPAGQEDITLSGQFYRVLRSFYHFEFDNNHTTKAAVESRKWRRRRNCYALIASLILFLLSFGVDVLLDRPQEKTFTADGVAITLTTDFKERKSESATAMYSSGRVVVVVSKDPLGTAPGSEEYTPEDYTQAIIDNSELQPTKVVGGEHPRFEYDYTDEENGRTYHYCAYVYKNGDSFWLIQFGTLGRNAGKYASKIEKWAGTVEFLH